VLIADVFRGQPAWQAGLRAGDVILEVNGQDVSSMGLSAAITLIRGPSGSTVRLRILRPASQETFEVDVVRARIRIPVVESHLLDGRVGYLHLTEFTADAADEVRTALQALTILEPSGLVLDLRGNPGGLLGSAIDVASFFVEGEIVTERTKSGEQMSYSATSRPLIGTIPLAVLIDEGSASASEIVAGAIQDKGPRTACRGAQLREGIRPDPHDAQRRLDAASHNGSLVHSWRSCHSRRGTATGCAGGDHA